MLPVNKSFRFCADVHLGKLARSLRMIGFDTFYKSELGASGLSRIPDGITVGFGPVNGSETLIKVRVIAIPKSNVDVYEKMKYPANAEKLFDVEGYTVYSATSVGEDGDVKSFIKSLSGHP